MDALNQAIAQISDVLWNSVLLFLLVGTGVYFSVRTRFVQVRKFKTAWNRVFGGFSLKGKKAGKDGMTSFQALATAIAAQVGTGNIAGCATALVSGGPGAIFWMWLAAFFGMATIFAEATLAQVFRARDAHGQIMGGPAFYISRGLNNKPLAAFFAVSIIIALGFIGNMVQANSIADGFHKAFEIPQWATGIFVFAIAGFIFIGGVRRIASFAEKMVPLMAVVYILGSLTIIFSNYDMILPAFKEIIVGAFDPSAATGGIIGASLKEAIRYGVARGLFSNEAGMGSTPHAHALAQVKHPCEQGLVAYVGLFFDTFIVLNMTALVILTTGVLDGKSTGIVLTQAAFTAGLGDIGPGFVAICLFFFAFTTIVGWYFFGEQNVKYLLGLRWVQSYRVLVLCFLMLGSFLHVTLVWELADFFNGIMVIPNVIALLALSGLVAKVLKDYDTKFMLGETPEYGALSPSGGEPFSLEPSPRKGRRFSRLKLRLRRKKTPPVNLDEMDQLKERGLDRF